MISVDFNSMIGKLSILMLRNQKTTEIKFRSGYYFVGRNF